MKIFRARPRPLIKILTANRCRSTFSAYLKVPNTVKGAANTVHMSRFFEEAAQTGNIVTQRPVLEYGDLL